MTGVRVVSWNLQWASGDRAARLGDLLAQTGEPTTIAMLQEANPEGLDRFCEAAGLTWWVAVQTSFAHLLSIRGRVGDGGDKRPRGARAAGTGFLLASPIPFPDVPLPEKVMAGWITLANETITVVTYHAPAGVQHQQRKPEQAVQLARWLESINGPVLFAGDFNTPEVDHPDHDKIKTHWHTGHPDLHGKPGDDLLVGPNEIHELRDVLRVWLEAHPDSMHAIRAERPDGPLAVSHRTGAARNPRRYDAIWATPHFKVHGVDYHYADALTAGSDHALVSTNLDYTPERVEPLPVLGP